MKHKNSRAVLKRFLETFGNPPHDAMESAADRVRQNLSLSRNAEVSELDSAVAEARFPVRRWSWPTTALAAMVVVIGILVPVMVVRNSAGTFQSSAGSGRLAYGAIIHADDTGSSVLTLRDGSRVEMRAGTELQMERADDGVRIRLNRGGVIVNAAKQRNGHLYVQTRDVVVSVAGTVFLVNAEAEGSRVAVIEGEVRVQQDGTETKLHPGEQVSSSPQMEPRPVKDEIAWSRQLEAHMALLEQSASVKPTAARDEFELISIRRNVVPPGAGGRGQGGGGNRSRNLRSIDYACSQPTEPVIDPRRFDTVNVTVTQLISWAYGMNCYVDAPLLLFGGPSWIREDGYDITANRPEGPNDYVATAGGVPGVTFTSPGPKILRMIHSMLEDRFSLSMHHETREVPVYLLEVAIGGPKFTRSRPMPAAEAQPKMVNGVPMSGSRGEGGTPIPELSVWKEGDYPCCDGGAFAQLDGRRKTMADLAKALSSPIQMGRVVLDRTNLKGEFNYFFMFAPVDVPGRIVRQSPEGPPSTETIFDQFKKVGLELKSSKEKVEVWVIDRVERPSEN